MWCALRRAQRTLHGGLTLGLALTLSLGSVAPVGQPATALAIGDIRDTDVGDTGGGGGRGACTPLHPNPSPIDQEARRFASQLGPLLEPDTETSQCQGLHREFQHGSIYWTPQTGAHALLGSVQAKWAGLGREHGALGYPTSDERPTPDGTAFYTTFQHGSIYRTGAGTFEVHGAIAAKWAGLDDERGPLGLPISDQRPGPDGIGQHTLSQHGTIYWTPQLGAQDVYRTSYVVRPDGIHIDKTRALDDDTDVASLAEAVGGRVQSQQTAYLGDVDDGDHPIGLMVGPVALDAASGPLVFNYQVLNSGHTDHGDIESLLKRGAEALAGYLLGSGNIWASAISWAVGSFAGLFDVNCDGPAAIDQVTADAATLGAWTAGSGFHRESRYYPGSDSPTGCGRNSQYHATWTVVRIPLPPPLPPVSAGGQTTR